MYLETLMLKKIKGVRFMLANIYYEMNDHKHVVNELEKVLGFRV